YWREIPWNGRSARFISSNFCSPAHQFTVPGSRLRYFLREKSSSRRISRTMNSVYSIDNGNAQSGFVYRYILKLADDFMPFFWSSGPVIGRIQNRPKLIIYQSLPHNIHIQCQWLIAGKLIGTLGDDI